MSKLSPKQLGKVVLMFACSVIFLLAAVYFFFFAK